MSIFLSILLFIGTVLLALFYSVITVFSLVLLVPFIMFLCVMIFIYYRVKLNYKKPEVFTNEDVDDFNINKENGGIQNDYD